jgi:hypothetical protein
MLERNYLCRILKLASENCWDEGINKKEDRENRR